MRQKQAKFDGYVGIFLRSDEINFDGNFVDGYCFLRNLSRGGMTFPGDISVAIANTVYKVYSILISESVVEVLSQSKK